MPVRKRGGHWYYDITVRGERYRGVIPEARTKSQAKRAEARIRDDIFSERYGLSLAVIKFSEFANGEYKAWIGANKRSAKSDYAFLKTLVSFFGDRPIATIKQIHVEKFKRERMSAPVHKDKQRQPASVNRELACLSRLFSIARENGYVREVPSIKLLREDNQRVRYLTEEEEKKLMGKLEAGRTKLRPLVILALHTGMRLGEMTSLMWKQIDFGRECINVTNTKTGKNRVIPMNDETRNLLYELRQSNQISECVFSKLPSVSGAFSYQCKRAGIEDFHFHDLRHTFATRLADAGVGQVTISYLLGHSTIQMSARYTHATDDRMRQAVAALSNRNTSRHKSVTSVIGDKQASTA